LKCYMRIHNEVIKSLAEAEIAFILYFWDIVTLKIRTGRLFRANAVNLKAAWISFFQNSLPKWKHWLGWRLAMHVIVIFRLYAVRFDQINLIAVTSLFWNIEFPSLTKDMGHGSFREPRC
jgi:hypothetical protein